MDSNFEWLAQKLGAPRTHHTPSAEAIASYRGKLPERLLQYWERYGYCSFADGLFSIVDPAEYESDLEAWAGDTHIVEQDAFYVIARSGFGSLYLWGTKTGYKYEIDVSRGWILSQDGDQAEIGSGGADEAVSRFFGLRKRAHFDVEDERGEALFDAAVAKFGPLAADEVFAFEPAQFMGGAASLDNIAKRNVHVYTSVLAQFGYREILDRDGLTRKAFG